MRILKITLIALLAFSITTSCFEDGDDNAISASEISDFVWKGMNAFYLYKDFKPDLANDRFSSNEEYASYLNNYSGPEELFDDLVYERQTVDRFSVLVNDYIALEQLFSGVTKNNGMEFGLFRFSSSDNNLYGYVRYILPNTDAETKGLQRGDLFNAVNGIQLTVDNWRTLLSPDNYTINLATYNDNGTPELNDDSVEPTSETVSLTKSPYTENPIYINEVIQVDGNNVGYLMYNGFTGTDQFDSQLNSVFGEFQSAGITDLILDLRYNGGGSVNTAIWLSSMITGQFTGDTFFTEQYNSDIQEQIIAQNPDFIVNPFVDEMIKRNSNNDIVFQQTINHVNLNRVYILTTGSTASASELVINGLRPYIDVVQIGGTTVGKYQASITVYDSDNFQRANANPNHTYAIQPLIYKSLNANGVTDYDAGLVPNIVFGENFANLGVLGNINEPYLAAALNSITGRFSAPSGKGLEIVKSNSDLIPFANDMHAEKQLPNYVIDKFRINK
jgi:C-terminal processing protease CtpA/Prc